MFTTQVVIVWLLFMYNPSLPVPNGEFWMGPYMSEKVCEAQKTIWEDKGSQALGRPSKFVCLSFHRDAQ